MGRPVGGEAAGCNPPVPTRYRAIPAMHSALSTQHSNGGRLRAAITDPVFVTRLELGYRPGPDCLVTVSVGMPYPPGGDRCWKLIAGVIDLANERVTAGTPLGDEPEEIPF